MGQHEARLALMIAAVDDFAAKHGRYWKRELRKCWEQSSYPSNVQGDALQRARNFYGPSWLARYRVGGKR